MIIIPRVGNIKQHAQTNSSSEGTPCVSACYPPDPLVSFLTIISILFILSSIIIGSIYPVGWKSLIITGIIFIASTTAFIYLGYINSIVMNTPH